MPIEVNLGALRVARQNDLSAVDYYNIMIDRIDDHNDERLETLREIERIN